MNNKENAWTKENLTALRMMRAEGKSIGQIADVLGRSRNAVKAKMDRIGLQGKAALFWNEDETRTLRACLNAGMSYEDIRDKNLLPGRSIAGMKARAAKVDAAQDYDPLNCANKFDRQLSEAEYEENAIKGSRKLLAAYERLFNRVAAENRIPVWHVRALLGGSAYVQRAAA